MSDPQQAVVKDPQQAVVRPKEPLVGMNTTNIQKLNGANFLPWRRQVKIVLKLREIEQALEDGEVDDTADMQATLILLETMDDAHRLQVQAEVTAREIMNCLERQYDNRSMANKHRLLARKHTFVVLANQNETPDIMFIRPN